jgi:hypothetical protein
VRYWFAVLSESEPAVLALETATRAQQLAFEPTSPIFVDRGGPHHSSRRLKQDTIRITAIRGELSYLNDHS